MKAPLNMHMVILNEMKSWIYFPFSHFWVLLYGPIQRMIFLHWMWFICNWRINQLHNIGDPPYKKVTTINCIILDCSNILDFYRAFQTFEAIGQVPIKQFYIYCQHWHTSIEGIPRSLRFFGEREETPSILRIKVTNKWFFRKFTYAF